MKLLRYEKPITTIFDLLGSKEDDMTYSLGYVLSRSPRFAQAFVRDIAGSELDDEEDGVVKLQTIGAEGHGRTDVEIRVPDRLAAILEAKRGPWLPTYAQLEQYARKLEHERAPRKLLVAVTNTPDESAARSLPSAIGGIAVSHCSWRAIKRLAERSRVDENHRNKHMLDEFVDYLRGILGMEISQSNMVYVVSLGARSAWGIGFKDVVERQRRYFYPTFGRWPEPPNYVAFRYDGKLQSIHHVEGHEVFTNPHDLFPEAESAPIKPHYCLTLGPAIRPQNEVRAGAKIVMSMRVWCMLDTLLTCDTITDAYAETKRRLGEETPEADAEELAGQGRAEADSEASR